MEIKKHKVLKNDCNITHIEVYNRKPLTIKEITQKPYLEVFPDDSLHFWYKDRVVGIKFYIEDTPLSLSEMRNLYYYFIEYSLDNTTLSI